MGGVWCKQLVMREQALHGSIVSDVWNGYQRGNAQAAGDGRAGAA